MRLTIADVTSELMTSAAIASSLAVTVGCIALLIGTTTRSAP
jgi:hypothetical protein